ncbi:MAG: hypothetical protein PUK59_02400 [Actinomycetaceae bacterium]|nr:hypothetical protein [Actinomycetaceae bacterium]
MTNKAADLNRDAKNYKKRITRNSAMFGLFTAAIAAFSSEAIAVLPNVFPDFKITNTLWFFILVTCALCSFGFAFFVKTKERKNSTNMRMIGTGYYLRLLSSSMKDLNWERVQHIENSFMETKVITQKFSGERYYTEENKGGLPLKVYDLCDTVDSMALELERSMNEDQANTNFSLIPNMLFPIGLGLATQTFFFPEKTTFYEIERRKRNQKNSAQQETDPAANSKPSADNKPPTEGDPAAPDVTNANSKPSVDNKPPTEGDPAAPDVTNANSKPSADNKPPTEGDPAAPDVTNANSKPSADTSSSALPEKSSFIFTESEWHFLFSSEKNIDLSDSAAYSVITVEDEPKSSAEEIDAVFILLDNTGKLTGNNYIHPANVLFRTVKNKGVSPFQITGKEDSEKATRFILEYSRLLWTTRQQYADKPILLAGAMPKTMQLALGWCLTEQYGAPATDDYNRDIWANLITLGWSETAKDKCRPPDLAYRINESQPSVESTYKWLQILNGEISE